MMARLEEICAINMGQSPDSSTYNEDGNGLPFFQGNADFGEIYPAVRMWCSEPTKIAREKDILISVRAPIGALNIANCECCIGRGLAALTVNEDICAQEYLWHALSGKVDELNSKGTGSTFKAINKKTLSETEIPLPPIDEQRKIAAILDKVSDLIAKRQQQLDKLDEAVYVMLVLALAGYLSLREDVAASIPLEGNVYLCDTIKSPFILGMFRPRIYLTSGMDEASRVCVLRHEKAHLRRGDHLWKPLGFLLLAVYWYNPLVWAAYILFCRDMELACDERVIRDMAAEERATYSQALLDCSRGRHWVAACPLAFGEVGVKTRVKAVLWYKKPAFWAVLAAVVVCAVVAVCFLTNPKGTENEEPDLSLANYHNVATIAYQTDTVTLTGYAGDVETTSGSTLGKLLSNADWTFLREGRADDGTDEDYTILAQVNDDTTLRFYAAAPGESTVKITAGDESRWYNMGEMGCADVRRALTQTDTLLLKLAAQAEEMDTFDMTWAYGDTLYTDNGIPAPVLTRFLRSEVWQPIESIDEASFQLAALLEIGDSTLYFYEDTLERNNLSFSVSNVIVSSGGAEHVYSIADSSFRDWLEGDARYLGQTGEEPETVLFGSYEQDGDAANGKEPIEWLVLARDGDKALLLSKYALDHQSFMPFYEPVTEPFTWESCSLRQWLNSTFLNAAFSAEEQRRLLTTTVITAPGGRKGSENPFTTEDRVFLLSDTEVYAYFSSEAATVTDYTAYALSEDPWAGNATAPAPAIWWLRTTDGGNHPDSVYTRGGVGEGARSYEGEYVRPAIWVDMSQTDLPNA